MEGHFQHSTCRPKVTGRSERAPPLCRRVFPSSSLILSLISLRQPMDQIRMLVGGDWPYSALLLPHRLTPGAADGAKSRAAADLDTFGVHDQHRKGGTMRPRQVTFLLMIVLGGM